MEKHYIRLPSGEKQNCRPMALSNKARGEYFPPPKKNDFAGGKK
jgi:hypothetical protein